MTGSNKQEQFELLKSILLKRKPNLLPVLDKINKGPLSELDRQEVQITIGEELASFGTDEAGEINSYGLELDDLISFVAQS